MPFLLPNIAFSLYVPQVLQGHLHHSSQRSRQAKIAKTSGHEYSFPGLRNAFIFSRVFAQRLTISSSLLNYGSTFFLQLTILYKGNIISSRLHSHPQWPVSIIPVELGWRDSSRWFYLDGALEHHWSFCKLRDQEVQCLSTVLVSSEWPLLS